MHSRLHPLATLACAGAFIGTASAFADGDGAAPPAQAAPGSAEREPYPIAETDLESAPQDARKLVQRAVDEMGGERFAALDTLSFRRHSNHWRGEFLAWQEDVRLDVFLTPTFAARRVEPNVNESGRRLNRWTAVENGDDRFCMFNIDVKASDEAEEMAARLVRSEAFAILFPLLAQAPEADAQYEGKVRIATFRPQRQGKPKPAEETAAEAKPAANPPTDSKGAESKMAFTDYKPVHVDCFRVGFEVPQQYRVGAGERATMWLSPETGRVLYFAFESPKHAVYRDEMMYEIAEWQEVGGLTLPKTMHVTSMDSATRLETLSIREPKVNPALDRSILRRP